MMKEVYDRKFYAIAQNPLTKEEKDLFKIDEVPWDGKLVVNVFVEDWRFEKRIQIPETYSVEFLKSIKPKVRKAIIDDRYYSNSVGEYASRFGQSLKKIFIEEQPLIVH